MKSIIFDKPEEILSVGRIAGPEGPDAPYHMVYGTIMTLGGYFGRFDEVTAIVAVGKSRRDAKRIRRLLSYPRN